MAKKNKIDTSIKTTEELVRKMIHGDTGDSAEETQKRKAGELHKPKPHAYRPGVEIEKED